MKYYSKEDMEDMIIKTRPSLYHYDKLTFSIANLPASNIISLSLEFRLNTQFDLSIILEDSKRKAMNYLLNCL